MSREHHLNDDFTKRVVVFAKEMEYVPAPVRGVWRKRLELSGDAEAGRVTSIVRYDSGARFPSHDHPEGEEILVLSGEWCDERGHFEQGIYQLNPEGFRHTPYTPRGCTLFVKLRQYGGAGRETILVDTRNASWLERGVAGVTSINLYRSEQHAEHVRLTRLAPGTRAPRIDLPIGEEIFVLSGSFSDEDGYYDEHTWLRLPRGSTHRPESEQGCILYVKSGGFPA